MSWHVLADMDCHYKNIFEQANCKTLLFASTVTLQASQQRQVLSLRRRKSTSLLHASTRPVSEKLAALLDHMMAAACQELAIEGI